MSIPAKKTLLNWAQNYPVLWNAGVKQDWIDNYRTVCPTDNVAMLDPVGTPKKSGFKHCCEDSWDLFQPRVRFRIQEGTLFVCGNEVAWCLENHFDGPEGPQVRFSIETYRFDEDGALEIRTYYRVPSHEDDSIGDLFQEYLPENTEGL